MNDAIQESVGSLLLQVGLNQAAALARASRHAEAEQVLASLPIAAREAPTVLDLLARIHAQQGRLRAAEEDWTQALRLDPTNKAYQDGLRRIAALQRKPLLWQRGLVATTALAIGFGLGVWVWQRQEPVQSVAKPPVVRTVLDTETVARAILDLQQQLQPELAQLGETQTTTREETAKILASLQAELRELRTEQASLTARLSVEKPPALRAQPLPPPAPPTPQQTAARPPEPPPVKLDVPGITTRTEGSSVLVTFTESIFIGGTTLSDHATEILKGIAFALKPHVDRLSITVVGYAAPGELLAGRGYRDDFALGLRRATVVAEFLREHAQWPPAHLSIQSAGNAGAPFLTVTTASRSRNRTVVLYISTWGDN